MPHQLEISLSNERLDEGSAEERASFGLFTIRSGDQSLTHGYDDFIKETRSGPLVSGYYIAQWFAWNWWRLCWEPEQGSHKNPDWAFAHRMTAIGEGYVWPNIGIFSDGEHTFIHAHASIEPDAKPFRYYGSSPLTVSSNDFENAVDRFVSDMIERLRRAGISETNLDKIWMEVRAERQDPEMSRYRRMEALLGRNPGAVDDQAVEDLLDDVERLGEDSIGEIATHAAFTQGAPLNADRIGMAAVDFGRDINLNDAVRLGQKTALGRLPAWTVGVDAARALRAQERLGTGPLSDRQLAEMMGTSDLLPASQQTMPKKMISFILDVGQIQPRIVLQPKGQTSARFMLARLIGDHLVSQSQGFYPATKASTYRQKLQKAFAAELLSPIDAVIDFLDGDYSEDSQQSAADYFNVSPFTISAILKNNHIIERNTEDFQYDYV